MVDEVLPSNCKVCGSKFLADKGEQTHFRYYVLKYGKDAARNEFNERNETFHMGHNNVIRL